MYLGELSDKEKNIFLDLGIMLASADDEFLESEKNAIALLCDEMKINARYSSERDYQECIDYLAKNSTIRNKRIIIFELVGIALSDQDYAEEENDFIKNIADHIGVEKKDVDSIAEYVTNLYKTYGEIEVFLGK